MNELLQILQTLATLGNSIRDRGNKALASLPPLEQIEGAEVVRSALREFRWASDQIADLMNHVDRLGGETFLAEVQSSIRATLLEEGYKTPGDHKDLLAQASLAGKAEADKAHADSEAAIKLAADRREEARATLGGAADSIADDLFTAENYRSVVEKMEGRLASMKEAGVTAETMPTAFASLSALALDESGDKELATRLAGFAEVKATLEPLIEKEDKGDKGDVSKKSSAPELSGKTESTNSSKTPLVFA